MPEKTCFRRLATLTACALASVSMGCDDPFGAFLRDVPLEPSEATLFDFVSGRLEDPPAFDIIFETPVRVDQTRNWDFLFRIQGGAPELVPFSAATDSVTDAALRHIDSSFEGVLEAPAEGYTLNAGLPIEEGDVIIARSRVDPAQSFLACNRYAKLEILDLDLEAGSLTFRFLANPNCGDIVLEPGKHGSL